MVKTSYARRVRSASVLGLIAGGALIGCGTSAASTDSGVVRFAVTDLQGMEELQREYGAFEETFEAQSGLDLEFYAVTSRTAAAAALESGEVDVVFTGPAEYVVIHERTDAEPLVAIKRDGYHSCIYTRTDTGVTTLADLAGEKIAMSDIGSTSGHLGPSQMLVDAGVDPLEDAETVIAGDAVHEALKRDDVAAVGIGCHDYEEFMAAEEDPGAYTLIAEGEDLPPDVVMARADLDEETKTTVRDVYTEHFPELLTAMLEGEDNAKYGNATVVEVSDADYDVARSMYQAIGVDDFSEFIGD
ncbi:MULTISPECIES: phosphate/phosphite/phosphonate ABC transporter substrate-binding protein [unclassified Modestobacter]